jgi:hypothetical protein
MTIMSRMRPSETDYAKPFARYVALVPEDDIVSTIEQQSSETQRLMSSLDDTKAAHRYEPGKWSVKEVIGHIIDAERIFGYRALAFSRGETASLPGWDENAYAATANFDQWRIGDLAELYAVARRSNIIYFRNLAPEAWNRRGIASNNAITVNALAYVIAGHERHHLQILHERYKV